MVGFIKSQLPKDDIDTFVDAFGGGFNVGVNINAKKSSIMILILLSKGLFALFTVILVRIYSTLRNKLKI